MPTLNAIRRATGLLERTIQDNSQGATNVNMPSRRMGPTVVENANAPNPEKNVQVLQGILMPTFPGNRTVSVIGVILLLATTGPACLAAPWNPDDTAPFERNVAQAADHARRIGCETSSCKAIIAIDEVVKGNIKKYEDVNKDVLYSNQAARTAARTLNAALLDHPALYAPVCQMSARLLSRFHNGPDVPDIAVPVQLLIESVDMDIRDHGHCAHDLITALPADKANIEIRLDAHALCVNDDNNHRRTRAACDMLIPGMTDPALDP